MHTAAARSAFDPQSTGWEPPDTHTHLLWASTDEKNGVDERRKLVAVDGLEGRVVGHPVHQVVGLALPLHGHARRHRVHADLLVQVLSVSAGLVPESNKLQCMYKFSFTSVPQTQKNISKLKNTPTYTRLFAVSPPPALCKKKRHGMPSHRGENVSICTYTV